MPKIPIPIPLFEVKILPGAVTRPRETRETRIKFLMFGNILIKVLKSAKCPMAFLKILFLVIPLATPLYGRGNARPTESET